MSTTPDNTDYAKLAYERKLEIENLKAIISDLQATIDGHIPERILEYPVKADNTDSAETKSVMQKWWQQV